MGLLPSEHHWQATLLCGAHCRQDLDSAPFWSPLYTVASTVCAVIFALCVCRYVAAWRTSRLPTESTVGGLFRVQPDIMTRARRDRENI